MAGGRFIPKKSNTVQHCQMTSVCCPFYPSSAVNLTAPNINNLSFFFPFHSLLVLVESLVVGSVSSASNYLAVNRREFFFFLSKRVVWNKNKMYNKKTVSNLILSLSLSRGIEALFVSK